MGKHLANTADNPHQIDLEELIPFWQREMTTTWRSWICTQTRQTFQQVQQGVPLNELGGNSNAMSVRFPAALAYFEKEEDVVDASQLAMFTHRETSAKQGAEFFARVAYRVVHRGMTPSKAIDEVAQGSPQFVKEKVKQAQDKVKEALDPNSSLSKEEYADDLALTSMARLWDVGRTEPIKVGKASPTEGTLPGSVYFILKYEDDFSAAVKNNAMVGGDNASRAIAIGMVLGAYHGVEAIPEDLRHGLTNWKHCEPLLESLLPVSKSTAQDEGGNGEL